MVFWIQGDCDKKRDKGVDLREIYKVKLIVYGNIQYMGGEGEGDYQEQRYLGRVLGLGIYERVDFECDFGYVEIEKFSRYLKEMLVRQLDIIVWSLRGSLSLSQ